MKYKVGDVIKPQHTLLQNGSLVVTYASSRIIIIEAGKDMNNYSYYKVDNLEGDVISIHNKYVDMKLLEDYTRISVQYYREQRLNKILGNEV